MWGGGDADGTEEGWQGVWAFNFSLCRRRRIREREQERRAKMRVTLSQV